MINKDFNNRYYRSKANQVFHTLYTTIIDSITYVVFVWSDGFVGYSNIKDFTESINSNLLTLIK